VECAPTPTIVACADIVAFAASTMPAITGDHPAVVCPADRDNFHWWQGAENLIKKVNQRQSTETSEMEAQKPPKPKSTAGNLISIPLVPYMQRQAYVQA